jgi:hypothetical protein
LSPTAASRDRRRNEAHECRTIRGRTLPAALHPHQRCRGV